MTFWHRLVQPIIGLAPMDGATDAAFRRITARYGRPDVMFTEFTNVRDLCHGHPQSLRTLRYTELERPIVAQLYGNDPEWFYRAAHVVCELGFDGLDVNMGCPSKNVAASGSGAALIRTPERALDILESARQGIRDWAAGQSLTEAAIKPGLIQAIHHQNSQRGLDWSHRPRTPIPLSVKTRLGYDTNVVNEWSACLIEGRPTTISIHGRTLAQMYRGEADWESIAQASALIRTHGILVLGNGDIRSLDDARDRIRRTGVHGVLIGRAALGNPWIFRGLPEFRRAYHLGGCSPLPRASVTVRERFCSMLAHARLFEHIDGPEAFPRMRKHLGWYCVDFPGAAAMRASMVKTTNSHDVAALIHAYDRGRQAHAKTPQPSIVTR